MGQVFEMEKKLAKYLMIAMPLYSAIAVPTFNSFIVSLSSLPAMVEKIGISMIGGSYVHLTRREIAKDILGRDEKSPVDYILWIDHDSVFSPQDIAGMLMTANENKTDILSGFYVQKHRPEIPLIYLKNKKGDGFAAVDDVPKDSLFEVDSVGFGFNLMRMDVLKKLIWKYGLEKLFNVSDEKGKDIGEDFLFCSLAKKEGFKIWVNSAIKIGHYGGVITPEIHYAMKEFGEKKGK
ncbi:MAG: hypothetical protein ABID38_03455 [Candidatus Diapherotrites archaeon]